MNTTSLNSLNKYIIIYLELDGFINFLASRPKHPVELLGLLNGSWETVE